MGLSRLPGGRLFNRTSEASQRNIERLTAGQNLVRLTEELLGIMNLNQEVGNIMKPLPPDNHESWTVSLFTCSQASEPNDLLKSLPAIVSFESRNRASFPFVPVVL